MIRRCEGRKKHVYLIVQTCRHGCNIIMILILVNIITLIPLFGQNIQTRYQAVKYQSKEMPPTFFPFNVSLCHKGAYDIFFL